MTPVLCVVCRQPIARGDYHPKPGIGRGPRHLECPPRLTVAELRRQRDRAEHRAARIEAVSVEALRLIAARPCSYGAGEDEGETCDTIPQPYLLPNVCTVCTARRALREIGVPR